MPTAITTLPGADVVGTMGARLFLPGPLPLEWDGSTPQIRARFVHNRAEFRVPSGLLYYRADVTGPVSVPRWSLVDVPAVDTVDLLTLPILHALPSTADSPEESGVYGVSDGSSSPVNGYGQVVEGSLSPADLTVLTISLSISNGDIDPDAFLDVFLPYF